MNGEKLSVISGPISESSLFRVLARRFCGGFVLSLAALWLAHYRRVGDGGCFRDICLSILDIDILPAVIVAGCHSNPDLAFPRRSHRSERGRRKWFSELKKTRFHFGHIQTNPESRTIDNGSQWV